VTVCLRSILILDSGMCRGSSSDCLVCKLLLPFIIEMRWPLFFFLRVHYVCLSLLLRVTIPSSLFFYFICKHRFHGFGKRKKFFVSVLLAKTILLGNFSLGCMLKGRDYEVTWTMCLWHH
jgi:hypothetical protein